VTADVYKDLIPTESHSQARGDNPDDLRGGAREKGNLETGGRVPRTTIGAPAIIERSSEKIWKSHVKSGRPKRTSQRMYPSLDKRGNCEKRGELRNSIRRRISISKRSWSRDTGRNKRGRRERDAQLKAFYVNPSPAPAQSPGESIEK